MKDSLKNLFFGNVETLVKKIHHLNYFSLSIYKKGKQHNG